MVLRAKKMTQCDGSAIFKNGFLDIKAFLQTKSYAKSQLRRTDKGQTQLTTIPIPTHPSASCLPRQPQGPATDPQGRWNPVCEPLLSQMGTGPERKMHGHGHTRTRCKGEALPGWLLKGRTGGRQPFPSAESEPACVDLPQTSIFRLLC